MQSTVAAMHHAMQKPSHFNFYYIVAHAHKTRKTANTAAAKPKRRCTLSSAQGPGKGCAAQWQRLLDLILSLELA
jgi:hypothetical protein